MAFASPGWVGQYLRMACAAERGSPPPLTTGPAPLSEPTPSPPQPWHATVVTLFPELFPGPLAASLAGDALKRGLWSLDTVALRDFGIGRHRQVDDTPAGGGAGMVLRADVVVAALDAARSTAPDAPAVYLSPRGEPLTQALVRDLAVVPGVILLAEIGRAHV